MILFVPFVIFVIVFILFFAMIGVRRTTPMALTKITNNLFLELESLACATFADMDRDPRANIYFLGGGTESVTGESAALLYELLEKNHPNGNRVPVADNSGTPPSPAGEIVLQTTPFPWAARTKAWYHRLDETGRGMFLAFINAKGSCSLRTFDADKGIFIKRHYRSGNYQNQFFELLNGATELTVPYQPNLERDCKERLPKEILTYLREQITK
jgi:hypothetical protein